MVSGVAPRIARWRFAWVSLALALALHVTDETLTGFLPLWNELVGTVRARYSWLPLPTFSFGVWLGGLIAGVILLLALTPFVSRGKRWIRIVSIILGVLMLGNSLGHMTASLYLGGPAPGVYSSPFLLFASVALLVTALRAGE